VRVRDAEYQPEDGARVEVLVDQPDGSVVPLHVEPSLREAGLFTAEHTARQAGPYTAHIRVTGDEGEIDFKRDIGWTADPLAGEFQQVGINRPALEQLAAQTGGELVPTSQLDDFVSRLARRDLPVMETETTPLWHQAWMLLGVLTLLAAEWGLRRWKGLA